MLEQVSLLVIIHPNIHVVKHPREEVVNLPRHIQDVADTEMQYDHCMSTYHKPDIIITIVLSSV